MTSTEEFFDDVDINGDLTIGGAFSLSGALDVTDTTGSTSSITGCATFGGGIGVAQNIFGGGTLNNTGATNLSTSSGTTTIGSSTPATVSAAGKLDVPNTTETLDTGTKVIDADTHGAINTKGDIQLYSSTGSCVRWSNQGFSPPSLTEHSLGSKLILFPQVTTQLDYAIGIELNNVWFSSGSVSTDNGFKWYTADTTSPVMQLGDGTLTITSRTGSEGGQLNLAHAPGSSGFWKLDNDSSDDFRLFGTDSSDTNAKQFINLDYSSGTTTIGQSTQVTISGAGVLDIANTTASTSSSTGCAIFDGGIGVAKTSYFDEDINSRSDNITQLVKNIKATTQQQVDSQTWIARSAATASSWQSVTWSPELALFCAVALNDIMTSPDGITWTTRTPAATNLWSSVTWSPELALFAAVCVNGINRVMTSPDGITWTIRTGAEINTWRSIIWSPELTLFCAVSSNGINRVMTSPDGITWTARSAAEVNSWVSVTWSPELSLFCAISFNGTNRVMTSPDGITWTARSGAAAIIWENVTWSPELSLFCAVGFNDVITSPDGITWTSRTAAEANTWSSIAWSPRLSLFCAVSTDGTNQVMTSPDGITWTTRSAAESNSWGSVIWSPELGIFCSVAGSGTNRVMLSTPVLSSSKNTMFGAQSSDGTTFIIPNPGDNTLWIQADTDNNGETDQASLLLSQDAQLVWGVVATDHDNHLSIRGGTNDGSGGNILFWTRGNAGSAITGIDDTLVGGASDGNPLGTNVLYLTNTNVNILGDLDTISAGTLTIGGSTATSTVIGSSNAMTVSAAGVLDVNNTANFANTVTLEDLDTISAGTLTIGGSTATSTAIGSSNALTVSAAGVLDVNNTANFANTVTLEAISAAEGGELNIRHGSGANNLAQWVIDSFTTSSGAGDPVLRFFGRDKAGLNSKQWCNVTHNGASDLSTVINGTVDFSGSLTVDDIDASTATILTLGASTATSVKIGAFDSMTVSAVGVVDVPSGTFSVTQNTADVRSLILVESKGDSHLWLKADTDNSATPVESDHPIIALSQDGQLNWSTIGYDNAASPDDLVIRAGNALGNPTNILFYCAGNSGGTPMSDPRDGLNTGTNIMTLTEDDVTIEGPLIFNEGMQYSSEPNIKYKHFTGVMGVGISTLSVAHGLGIGAPSKVVMVDGMWKNGAGANGDGKPLTINYVDGTNINITAGATNRSYRFMVWYTNSSQAWTTPA